MKDRLVRLLIFNENFDSLLLHVLSGNKGLGVPTYKPDADEKPALCAVRMLRQITGMPTYKVNPTYLGKVKLPMLLSESYVQTPRSVGYYAMVVPEDCAVKMLRDMENKITWMSLSFLQNEERSMLDDFVHAFISIAKNMVKGGA